MKESRSVMFVMIILGVCVIQDSNSAPAESVSNISLGQVLQGEIFCPKSDLKPPFKQNDVVVSVFGFVIDPLLAYLQFINHYINTTSCLLKNDSSGNELPGN